MIELDSTKGFCTVAGDKVEITYKRRRVTKIVLQVIDVVEKVCECGAVIEESRTYIEDYTNKV